MRLSYLLFLCCLCGHTYAAEPLRWKFVSNVIWNVNIEQQTEWNTLIGGKTSVSRMSNNALLQWKITKVTDSGNAEIAQKMQHIKIKMEIPKQDPIVYDSQSAQLPVGDAKAIAETAYPLLNATFTCTMSPRGEVSDSKLTMNKEEILKKYPNWQEQAGAETWLANALGVPLHFPEQEVAENESWTFNSKIPFANQQLQQQTTYKLVKHMADTSTIDYQTALTPADPKNQPWKSYVQSGKFIFQPEIGFVQSGITDQKIVTVSLLKDATVEVTTTSNTKINISQAKE
jgi:hypothetical protein